MNCRFRCCSTRWSTAALATALVFILAAGGCGPSGPKRIQVHGTITFGGNSPPADGAVYFAAMQPAPGFPARGGYGTFAKGDGSFVVGSVKVDDGLMPGKYRLTVECWDKPPHDGSSGKSFIPAGYVPPEFEIKVDQRGPVPLEIDIPLGG